MKLGVDGVVYEGMLSQLTKAGLMRTLLRLGLIKPEEMMVTFSAEL